MVAGPGRRLARLALLLAVLLIAVVVTVLVLSHGILIVLLVLLIVAVIVVAATSWWAFTTQRPWKRWLNIGAAILAAGMAALLFIGFSMRFAGGMLAIAALTVAYAETARRALRASEIGLLSDTSAHSDWPTTPWLLVNPRSGDGKAARLGLMDAARSRGIRVHVLQPGENAADLTREAIVNGADAIGAAGGDGTLAMVAAVAIDGQVPFMCVPIGTRNHFAADLGLDRSRPLTALDVVDQRQARKVSVDLGVVNGRLFLNNVSLGAYADLVSEPGYRANKIGTAHAILPLTFRGQREPLQITVRLPDGRSYADAVVLFVANNPYSPSPLESGARPRLDSGELQVSLLRARTGKEIVSILRSGGRVTPGAETWAQWTTRSLLVESAQPQVAAGIDGESVTLNTPLEFRNMPKALQVLVPGVPRRRRRLELLAPFRRDTLVALWQLARSNPR
jgi:diacylglycerol kinase family enzyme